MFSPKHRRRAGFTLVELLVVVAIIGILAGIVSVALPRAIEKAKIARMTGALNQLRTALTQYYTESNSYPPAYGYRSWQARSVPPFFEPANVTFHVSTLQAALGLCSAIDLYDEFSEGYSTSVPPRTTLALLEFSPIFRTESGRNVVTQPVLSDPVTTELYNGSNLPQQVQAQLEQTSRPFIYIPVNKNQFARAKRYWQSQQDYLATTWNPTDQNLQGMTFPPPNYDAYVLISVGPGRSSFGLIDEPPFINSIPPEDRYHVAGLRSYYLATRDINGNGIPDLTYQGRVTEGDEASAVSDVAVSPLMQNFFQSRVSNYDPAAIFPNSLPDPQRFNGFGPWVYASE